MTLGTGRFTLAGKMGAENKKQASDDWKRKIDNFFKKEEVTKEEAEARKQQLKEAAERRKWQSYFERYQKTFVCHICHQPSQHPAVVRVMVSPGASGEGGYDPTYKEYTDFGTPADMERCIKCKKWTHDEHLYRGICQKDAEKL